MLKKILVANRGEIAIRVMKACKELSIETVAIFADNDRDCLHAAYADHSYNLGTGALSDTYLNIDKIIEIAKESGAEAIHPGYGFLSENARFSRACEQNNIIFIGPTADVMEAMGDKLRARAYMKEAGVPITPGTDSVKTVDEVIAFGEKYGYPIALKASAGGGGKGLRPVFKPEQVKEALEGAMREGKNYFGDDTIYVEKFLERPRHIEVQILGDSFGNVIHVGERNCSVQRRHQKLIEEAPSPELDHEVREKILSAAVQGAAFLKYRSAGTFEFLEQDGNFYFMEVNSRLQVEHPVTEMIHGIDLVKEQISIASGNKLNYRQSDIIPRGHAIEFRVTVEDVKNNFRPMAGTLEEYIEPSGYGVRVDSTGKKGWKIPSEYDSMISKLIVWDENRNRAIQKARRVLDEYIISGVPTTIAFHRWAMDDQSFIDGTYTTKFIPERFKPEYIKGDFILSSGTDDFTPEKEELQIEVNGKLFNVRVLKDSKDKTQISKKAGRKKKGNDLQSDNGNITAPMASTIVKVVAEAGKQVKQGDLLLVLEAMKMETDINAPKDGTIRQVSVKAGDSVSSGDLLILID